MPRQYPRRDVRVDERRKQAASFAGVADVYERSRPGYPEAAVVWLAGSTPGDVVDLGAGTGKLTRSLVALGHRVTAVEPLEEMLAQLRASVPAARALTGGAEAIPLPDASIDVVTCAQAFHWFDHDRALAEIARVLRPGGRIALVWNMRDDERDLGRGAERRDRRSHRSRSRSGRADRAERSLRPGRARGLRARAGGRPHDDAGARALAELLRDPPRGGAGPDPRPGRRHLRPARPGRRPARPVPHRVLSGCPALIFPRPEGTS